MAEDTRKKRTFYLADSDLEKLKTIAESFFNTSNKLMGEALRKTIDEKYNLVVDNTSVFQSENTKAPFLKSIKNAENIGCWEVPGSKKVNFSKEYDILKSILWDLDKLFFSNIVNLNIDIASKGENDLVTSLDVDIERYIIDKLLEQFPEDNIVSEETRNYSVLKDRNWIIDPIDGTCNFANNIPIYGIQIALMNNVEPLLSIIYLPSINELYYAEKGKGAYLNDAPISTSQHKTLEKSVITIGDFSKSNPLAARQQLEIMAVLHEKVLKIRMFGAACYDFCFLATGRTQTHIMFSRNLWDIIPGLLLAKEAGACISSLDGSEFDINKGSLIASSNESIHKLILKNLKNA